MRMLRRLRYMLYARILRFPLPQFRKVSQGELIPMITAEVEPLGGFIGDAFALPALQGGLLLTSRSSRARLRASAACRFSSIIAFCADVNVAGGDGAAGGGSGSQGSGALQAPQQKTAHLLPFSST